MIPKMGHKKNKQKKKQKQTNKQNKKKHMISLILVPITHTWLKLSSRALRSHKLHYCISFFFSPSRSLLFHPLFIYFLLAKETPCKLFFLLMKGSSCREEWAFLARTLHSSQSQPSIHAPAPWHGLFLFSVAPLHSYFQRMWVWSPFRALRWWPAALHICSEALGCQ